MTTPLLDRVDNLVALLGPPASGDRLSQLAHGLQCAHALSLVAPDDIELQVAGLFHDIGHALVPGDDAGHGTAGGDALRPVFGERVAELVELHVPAKRYLVTTDPAYGDELSAVSTVTLVNQGGPMSRDEVDAFEQLTSAHDAVTLRRADEAAKVPGQRVRTIDTWFPTLLELAREIGR